MAFGMLGGIVLGIINGVTLSFLTFKHYNSTNSETQYRRSMLITSIIITFVGGFIIYYNVLYPFARTLLGTVYLTLPAAIIATLAAGYASQRISNWYLTRLE